MEFCQSEKVGTLTLGFVVLLKIAVTVIAVRSPSKFSIM